MSWPRLAKPRGLVGSLVRRGDDLATDFSFFLCPPGGLSSASESPCSTCLTTYTQACPACLPVPLCLLNVVLLFRVFTAGPGLEYSDLKKWLDKDFGSAACVRNALSLCLWYLGSNKPTCNLMGELGCTYCLLRDRRGSPRTDSRERP